MTDSAADLARRLGCEAEAVCRHYLSNGRRQGRYWLVGDARNTLGRSMYVRLTGPPCGKGAAGKWSDAATGEHGDLLDVIRLSCGFLAFNDVLAEARRFLSLPTAARQRTDEPSAGSPPPGSRHAAQRLLAVSQPIRGTLVETYLRGRGITALHETEQLRFHSRCFWRPEIRAPAETWPAMIATVTDLDGSITGAHRTWLSPDGDGKAPVASPRRAMGELLGHAVRFGVARDVMAVGEGIETVLSLRGAMPTMPMAAALSAAHLAAIVLPPALSRLYIARDDDAAGEGACRTLVERARARAIEAIVLSPAQGDFNADLRTFGIDPLRAAIRPQLAPQDVARFLSRSE